MFCQPLFNDPSMNGFEECLVGLMALIHRLVVADLVNEFHHFELDGLINGIDVANALCVSKPPWYIVSIQIQPGRQTGGNPLGCTFVWN